MAAFHEVSSLLEMLRNVKLDRIMAWYAEVTDVGACVKVLVSIDLTKPLALRAVNNVGEAFACQPQLISCYRPGADILQLQLDQRHKQ